MSSTNLTAGEVMDRSAALLNDPAKTDYTYLAQLPYLNIAIDELNEYLEESNSSPSSQTWFGTILEIGDWILSPEGSAFPGAHYPDDLVEIQEISERTAGTNDSMILLPRIEFFSAAQTPATSSLQFWYWEDQLVKFHTGGATERKGVQVRYVRQSITLAIDGSSLIGGVSGLGVINARSYLSFKTAALCAQFIGENETRAGVLNMEAERAIERMIGISSKGRQQIVTRHRPFRASYKMRGGF